MAVPLITPLAENNRVQYGAAKLGLGLTEKLATFISELTFSTLPDAVVHQAKRALVDWLGCALAGSQHPTLAYLRAGIEELGDVGPVPIVGRPERYSRLSAALINGQAGHVLDFDDTHMGGVILHASSPILAALIASSFGKTVSGERFLSAYVAGFETAVRLGQAAPDHHAGGWHLTGTLGTVGAAAACANLHGLSPERCIAALGIAATQAAGMQQNRGTSCKSLHAGKAASNGLLSAVLAAQGFSASSEILEGKKGFIRIYSSTQNPTKLIDGLGQRWELLSNGYKPYACGVVLHPAIDAMIAMSKKMPANPAHWQQVASVQLEVHPDAIRITGVQQPGSGLMSKFSIAHAAAVSFIDQSGGLEQFSDSAPARSDVQSLSQLIEVNGLDSLAKDQAQASCTLVNGDVVRVAIEHATGTVNNPLTDEQLSQKYLGNIQSLSEHTLLSKQLNALWHMDTALDAARVFLEPGQH